MNNKEKVLGILIALSIFSLKNYNISFAESMSNSDYILEIDPTNIQASPSTSPKQTDNITPLPLSEPRTSSNLQLSLQNTLANFGKVRAGEPLIRSIHLAGQSANGFALYSLEDANLKAENNTVVQDTTCDDGNCSELIGSAWKNPLTFGFGYRCDSQARFCDKTFLDQNIYKQIANESNSEKALMFGKTYESQNLNLDLNLKLNIPETLTTNSYHNTIHIIALPLLSSKN